MLKAERAIHFAMFALLLVGLFGMSAWASYAYLPNDLLKLASIALTWGITLIVLYIVFEKLEWGWWR